MMNNTWLWCICGFICFCVGGVLRMFMVVRVKGWEGYLKPQSGAVELYKRLAANHKAPAWPLPVSYICIALGICIIFGSILIAK